MNRLRILVLLTTIILVFGIGWAISLLARGYRFDTKNPGFRPSGLLVVTSEPGGAEILIDGELESATNATISLPPDTYDIEVKKETFLPWKKRLTIKKEEVSKVDVVLFPVAPSLSPLTFTGALRPVLSPDRTKIAYAVPDLGLWVMELGNLPIGFSRDPRQITNTGVGESSWKWSPDSREILLNTDRGIYLLDASTNTPQAQIVNIQGALLTTTLEDWEKQEDKKRESRLYRLPDAIQDVLDRKASFVRFSPDENKVLYTASGSANLADNLIHQLPGSSTQEQKRNIEVDQTYVYDIKEDRNFWITPGSKGLAWFPTSNHIVLAEQDKITIMDYDGTNRQVVWSGPYVAPYAIPFPNTTRLLILTSLSTSNGNASNLYGLSLR